MKRRSCCGWTILPALILLTACRGEAPTSVAAPEGEASTTRLRLSDPGSMLTETSTRRASAGAAQPPRIVFKVQPAPNADGIITGLSPFEVTFNLCTSEDPDGDRLLFTMDADGDGKVDESGTHGGNCRRTFTYTAATDDFVTLSPEVCVVDLDGAGVPQRSPECRRYGVQVTGPPPPAPPLTCHPGPGGSGWISTGGPANADKTCTCLWDGAVLAWFGPGPGPAPASTFTGKCFANGGGSSNWKLDEPCDCY